MRDDPDLDIVLPTGVAERDAIDAALPLLASLFANGRGDDVALTVVSANAGASTALAFWHNALQSGVGLANPEMFPWCLANAACGALARHFGITGPNTTMIGGDEAVAAARVAAELALEERHVSATYIVEINFAAVDKPGRLRAWRLPSANETAT